MKKKLIFFTLILFCIYILLYPNQAVVAATKGLMLWYQKVLPALLPFAILSNILIDSNYLSYITRFLSPVLRLLLPVSKEGAFVVLSGFFFGFPMGSRNCAMLLKKEQLSFDEAEILFIITNNISPVFISGYILFQQLNIKHFFLITILVLYLPPLFLGELLLHRKKKTITIHKNTASRSKMNFQIIDAGIMNGFETLVRIGGYIMLFSIMISMIKIIALPQPFAVLLTGIMELTNGISELSHLGISLKEKYVMAMAFTAFGGISGMAQTSSMIKGTCLSMKRYLGYKLLLTLLSTLLAIPAAIFLLN